MMRHNVNGEESVNGLPSKETFLSYKGNWRMVSFPPPRLTTNTLTTTTPGLSSIPNSHLSTLHSTSAPQSITHTNTHTLPLTSTMEDLLLDAKLRDPKRPGSSNYPMPIVYPNLFPPAPPKSRQQSRGGVGDSGSYEAGKGLREGGCGVVDSGVGRSGSGCTPGAGFWRRTSGGGEGKGNGGSRGKGCGDKGKGGGIVGLCEREVDDCDESAAVLAELEDKMKVFAENIKQQGGDGRWRGRWEEVLELVVDGAKNIVGRL
eukprot:GHVQ01003691.1.p1 GENE.GHVQ01003691.1~~GHVQ01003691.1.p1  ORF type:complete len:260 (-),score=66.77 GHVQ01003691.1:1219-1998(-)